MNNQVNQLNGQAKCKKSKPKIFDINKTLEFKLPNSCVTNENRLAHVFKYINDQLGNEYTGKSIFYFPVFIVAFF